MLLSAFVYHVAVLASLSLRSLEGWVTPGPEPEEPANAMNGIIVHGVLVAVAGGVLCLRVDGGALEAASRPVEPWSWPFLVHFALYCGPSVYLLYSTIAYGQPIIFPLLPAEAGVPHASSRVLLAAELSFIALVAQALPCFLVHHSPPAEQFAVAASCSAFHAISAYAVALRGTIGWSVPSPDPEGALAPAGSAAMHMAMAAMFVMVTLRCWKGARAGAAVDSANGSPADGSAAAGKKRN